MVFPRRSLLTHSEAKAPQYEPISAVCTFWLYEVTRLLNCARFGYGIHTPLFSTTALFLLPLFVVIDLSSLQKKNPINKDVYGTLRGREVGEEGFEPPTPSV